MRGSLKPISATILCRSCHLRAPEMHSPVFRTQQREYLDVDNDSVRSVVFTLSLANLRVLCVCMHLIRSYLLSSGLHCVAINQHNAHEGVVNKILMSQTWSDNERRSISAAIPTSLFVALISLYNYQFTLRLQTSSLHYMHGAHPNVPCRCWYSPQSTSLLRASSGMSMSE